MPTPRPIAPEAMPDPETLHRFMTTLSSVSGALQEIGAIQNAPVGTLTASHLQQDAGRAHTQGRSAD